MERINKLRKGVMGTLAIFTLYLMFMSDNALMVALDSIWEAFPDVSFDTLYYVVTVAQLVCIPCILICGAIVGKKLKFRTMAVISNVLMLVGGLGPVFVHSSFTTLLVFRGIYGAGFGLVYPLTDSLLIGNYSGSKLAKYWGWGTIFTNLAGILFSSIAVPLISKEWYNIYWAYALVIIPMALIIFIPEPSESGLEVEEAAGEGEIPAVKEKMSPFIWVIAISLSVAMLAMLPSQMNISMITDAAGLDVSVASLAISLFTVGGMVASLLNEWFFKKFGMKEISIGFVLCAVSQLLILPSNKILIYIAFIVLGIGYTMQMLGLYMLLSLKTPLSTSATAMSICGAMVNIAAFLLSGYSNIIDIVFGNYLRSTLIVGAVIFAVMAVAYLFVKADMPEETEEVKE